jgi:DNA repair exonuclease SbcCD ATPase subunit
MFSYGQNNEIDFTKSTVSQILGKNGHGKSTIAHILEELLFNKNSKGFKKATILNRNTYAITYTGAVEFEKDGDLYTVTVSRTGVVQKVSLKKNGEDISQHTTTATYELIEKLFGRDFKMFSQLIYQNSRSSLQFLTATDTIRKRFLIDLLNLEKYLDIYENIKVLIKDVTTDLNIHNGELIGLESWIKNNKLKNLVHQPLKENIFIPENLVLEYKELSQLLNDINTKNTAILKNNQYRSMRDAVSVEHLIKNINYIDINDLLNIEITLKHNIDNNIKIKHKIKELKNRCHTCEQIIEASFRNNLLDELENTITKYKNDLDNNETNLIGARLQNAEYEKVQKSIADFERYSNFIDNELPIQLHDRDEIEFKVNILKDAIDKFVAENNEIIMWNKEANNNNSKLELIKEQLVTAELNITKLKLNIAEINKVLNHLDVLKKAFSTNGLLAYKLEYSVKELEALTNEYLLELSDGRFQLIYAVVNDKLNIIIKDNNIDVEIEALSSGELARVTTATLLAIRKLLASLSKDSINVLFLDEVIDVLDEEGKERLIDILIKETDLNTYIVSHGFTHPLLTKLKVEKVNNISRITND